MSWPNLANWWLEEVGDDPAYEQVVSPLLAAILGRTSGGTYIDLGSGEGRVAQAVAAGGARVIGIDISETLARRFDGPIAVGEVRHLPLRPDSGVGAFAVLVLEHLEDHVSFFKESSRVVRAGGVLCIVSNHPIWTSPDSTPIEDADGEILWRPGNYFSPGSTDIEVEGGTVTFHHRSMADLLNAAAAAGWSLEEMIERPHHELSTQEGIPRLLACRWRLLP